jgi:hypothetical protein
VRVTPSLEVGGPTQEVFPSQEPLIESEKSKTAVGSHFPPPLDILRSPDLRGPARRMSCFSMVPRKRSLPSACCRWRWRR